MVLPNIQMAEIERASQKSTISFLLAQLSTVSDRFEADYYLTKVKAVEKEVLETHKTILACVPLDIAIHQQEHEGMLKEIANMICTLMRKKANYSSDTMEPRSGTDIVSILLPHFNGVSAEWMEFKKRYMSTIHTNQNLEGEQKLSYLKSCFVGEAENFLKSILLADTQYDSAWQQVVERFEKRRELVFIELRKFFRQPQMQSDSADGIQDLLEVSHNCIHILVDLGEPVFQWDTILVFLILEKLDFASRQSWELTVGSTEMPKLNDVLTFLETRARVLTAREPYSTKKPRLVERSEKRPFGHNEREMPSNTSYDETPLNTTALQIENKYLRQRIELLQKQIVELENLHMLRDTRADVPTEVQEVNVVVTGRHSQYYVSNHKQVSRNYSRKRWFGFTSEEDEKIVKYLKNQGVRGVGINSGTWEAMKAAIFSQSPHTVNSLENRYRKTIVPKLEDYFSTSTECDEFKRRVASNLKRKKDTSNCQGNNSSQQPI